MKAIALANRLARDLNEKSAVDLAADARLEILDAINGALQKMHAVSPPNTKITTSAIYLDAPTTVTFAVTQGETAITGLTFSSDQYGRSIRIAGDDIDNQIAGTSSLLHPYTGATGTVTATIYADAVAIPEPYSELVGDPRILETGRDLIHHKIRFVTWHRRNVCEPRFYWVEPNAGNRSSPAPAVVRFDSLPDRAYRLTAEAMLAPARVSFSDLLAPGPEISIRQEHVEIYLLPIARGLLTASELWKNPESKSATIKAAETAEAKYEVFASTTLATPANEVGTPHGF